MSEIKVNSIKGVGASAAAITVNNTDGSCSANLSSINNGQVSGFRNFLINGAMQLNERIQTGTLGYYNPVTASIYTLDRWRFSVGNSFDTNSARITQDSASPNGFSNSWFLDIYNTQTPTALQNAGVEQRIEAQFLQGLGYGTSAAKTMTLSFHVRSYKTGTYCVQIMQEDGSKYQLHEYTISASNTWEKKTITIVGNTADAINNDNGTGLRVVWALACGSSDHVSATSSWVSGGSFVATSNQVNLWDNGNNNFYLTGCQLEIGTVATEFEHRSVAHELALCQRYYYVYADARDSGSTGQLATGFAYHNGQAEVTIHYPVMRATPSLVQATGTNYYGAYNNGGNATFNSFSWYQASPRVGLLYYGSTSGLTQGQAYRLQLANDNAYIHLEAEL